MTHAIRARKERGAKIAVIDIYDTPDDEKQADIRILLKPGTDGAFACAVMHVLFREGLADRDYLDRYSDDPAGLESHLRDRTPEWAEAICGVPVTEIEAFRATGGEPPSGPSSGSATGFTRPAQRARSTCMRRCPLAVVTGCYQYEGGGCVSIPIRTFSVWVQIPCSRAANITIPALRWLDQSMDRPGADRRGRGAEWRPAPVTAMLVQNTNPANVRARAAQGLW